MPGRYRGVRLLSSPMLLSLLSCPRHHALSPFLRPNQTKPTRRCLVMQPFVIDSTDSHVARRARGLSHPLTLPPARSLRYNEAVYLKRRTGFVRMAKKHGASIVPVFGVGQSDLYSYWRPLYDAPSTAWTRRVFVRLSKMFRFVPMVAGGRGFTPLPYRQRVEVVIGAPIAVGDGDGGVGEGLETYIERLRAMYEGAKEGRGKRMVVH